jgi:hypothetical protein
VISLPPSSPGASNATVAEVSPGVTDVIVGAPGVVAVGVTELEGAEAELVPTAFVAVTVHVTAVPLARPVTAIGDVVPVVDRSLASSPHVAV